MRRKFLSIGLILAGIILISTVIVIAIYKNGHVAQYKNTHTKRFESTDSHASFDYPDSARLGVLSADDTKQHVLARIEHTDQPEYLITVRTESNLQSVAQLAHTDIRTLVYNNAKKALPERYTSDYHEISSRTFEFTTLPAAEIIFQYTGPAGLMVTQRLVMMIHDDSVYYIAAQSKTSDYDTATRAVFEGVLHSLAFRN